MNIIKFLLIALIMTSCVYEKNEPGTPTITKTDLDHSEHSDTQAPIITLIGSDSIRHEIGTPYTDLGATVEDDVDQNITYTISGEILTDVKGTYTLSYFAIDNSGNETTITRTVEVDVFKPFITTWQTNLEGFSQSNQIKIGTQGGGYNYSIDWGDGTVNDNVTGDIIHDYAIEGTYTVKITGDFPRIYFEYYEGYDREKLLTIEQWGDIKWTSMNNAFYGCNVLVVNATDAPDLFLVKDMTYMFRGAKSFNSPVDHWNVSSVEDMTGLFSSALIFNQNLTNWDVSNVKNMNEMFSYAKAFNSDISTWNVSSVTSMEEMFLDAYSFNSDISLWDVSNVTNMEQIFQDNYVFNQDIGNWDVSNVRIMRNMFAGAYRFNKNLNNWDVTNVTSMNSMFDGAKSFNGDISDWNVSNVKSMEALFRGAELFTQDITNWDVSSVTSMHSMFKDASNFNQDIGRWDVSNVNQMSNMFKMAGDFNQDISIWDVSKVTNMTAMFHGALSFNQNIGAWDVSSVTTMEDMFRSSVSFNQDIGNWDVSSVTRMTNMFNYDKVFDQDLSRWDVSSVTNMWGMFKSVKLSTTNYDALLTGWYNLDLQKGVSFYAGNSQYSQQVQSIRDSYRSTHDWSIYDGGLAPEI